MCATSLHHFGWYFIGTVPLFAAPLPKNVIPATKLPGEQIYETDVQGVEDNRLRNAYDTFLFITLRGGISSFNAKTRMFSRVRREGRGSAIFPTA
jgi:hypothetical protein